MSAFIIDGNKISEDIRKNLEVQVPELKKQTGKVPGLAVVLVGEDPASQVYVRMKGKRSKEVGYNSFEFKQDADVTEEALLKIIDELNERDDVNGILVQLPLPGHINEKEVINRISPAKDVDGFHPANVGKMLIGDDTFLPCTPYGVQQMLKYSNIETSGKYVVVIGRSNIVGKPVAAILVQKADFANATVTICHSRTKNMKEITKQADIIIAAIGMPEFLTADMVSDKAVIIDVGINRVDDASKKRGYRLVGDAAYDELKDKVSAITPVPGGVGPMTIAMLLSNTMKAFKQQNGIELGE